MLKISSSQLEKLENRKFSLTAASMTAVKGREAHLYALTNITQRIICMQICPGARATWPQKAISRQARAGNALSEQSFPKIGRNPPLSARTCT